MIAYSIPISNSENIDSVKIFNDMYLTIYEEYGIEALEELINDGPEALKKYEK